MEGIYGLRLVCLRAVSSSATGFLTTPLRSTLVLSRRLPCRGERRGWWSASGFRSQSDAIVTEPFRPHSELEKSLLSLGICEGCLEHRGLYVYEHPRYDPKREIFIT